MFKFKKALVGSLALASSLFFLSACGGGNSSSGGDSEDGKVTLRFSYWDEFPEEAIQAFNEEYPDIKIEHVKVPGDDYSQKVNQMVAGGTAPDVMVSYETDYPRFAKAGAIEDLEPYLKESDKIDASDFIPAVQSLADQTGGTYGLPWCYATELLFYNKDMFDKAGIEYPTNEWTWDDYSEAAKKLTIKDGSRTTQWGSDTLTFGGIWYALAGQAGDDVVKDNKLALGDGMTKALEFMNKLTNEDKSAPKPAAGTNVSDLFAAGKAAMSMSGSWMATLYSDADFNWDIQTLPKGEKAYNSLHTGFYTISSQSKHKDEAWKFVEFMMSEKGQNIFSETQKNPSALQTIAEQGAYRSPGENGPENWGAYDEAGAEGRFGYTMINTKTTNDLIDQFNSYLLGNKTIDEIIEKDIPKENEYIEKNAD